jgi:hypothetical protein
MSNLPPGVRVCDLPGYNDDVHPISEELWALLENNGIPENDILKVEEKLNEALKDDLYIQLSDKNIIDWISYCKSFIKLSDENYIAIIYDHGHLKDIIITGNDVIDTIVKCVTAFDNLSLTPLATKVHQKVIEVVYRNMPPSLTSKTIVQEAVVILKKIKRTAYYGQHPEWPVEDKEIP